MGERPRLRRLAQVTLTFSLVTFAWIFFKAATVSQGFSIVGRMLSGYGFPLRAETLRTTLMAGISVSEFFISLLAIGILISVEIIQKRRGIRSWINARPVWIRWTVYYGVVFAILLFGVFESEVFIYELF